MSIQTFSWGLHPKNRNIVRTCGKGGYRLTEEHMTQVMVDLEAFFGFVKKSFGAQPIRLMTVLENMSLALDSEQEMTTQGSLMMAGMLKVDRAAYVTDRATLRMQFMRLFRENKLEDRFRSMATEAEALEFLSK